MGNKTIQLRCQTCGGMMTVEENNSVLSCPYCCSKELIKESDEVVIERIKNNTYKDVELNKLQYEEEKEKRLEEKEAIQKFKEGKLSKAIVAFFVICLLACIISFSSGSILAGIVALVQVALFSVAWLMGMQIIKKKPNLHIVAAVFGFVLIFLFFKANAVSSNTKSKSKLEWPKMGICTVLPTPETENGSIITNSGEGFYASLDDITEEQYQSYLKACQDIGFTVEAEDGTHRYTAFNSDGYKLKLIYYSYNEELSIDLDAPIEMKEIKWPDSEIAQLLPKPKSNIGKISWERSSGFFIYVGNTSKSDFDDYVYNCKSKGFTVDYDSGEDFYYSDNENGYHISLSYDGNNVMSVNIEEPYKFKTEEKTETKIKTETTIETEKTSIAELKGIRSEFKEALDAYEEFFDEYCEIMKQYMDNPLDMNLLTKYSEYVEKAEEMDKKLEALDNGEMSDDEMAYYLEVTARVTTKMLGIYQ